MLIFEFGYYRNESGNIPATLLLLPLSRQHRKNINSLNLNHLSNPKSHGKDLQILPELRHAVEKG
jgi:hypothetical protein